MTYLTMIRLGSQASCFLREPFFASLGEESQPEGELPEALGPRFQRRRSLARRILRDGQG